MSVMTTRMSANIAAASFFIEAGTMSENPRSSSSLAACAVCLVLVLTADSCWLGSDVLSSHVFVCLSSFNCGFPFCCTVIATPIFSLFPPFDDSVAAAAFE